MVSQAPGATAPPRVRDDLRVFQRDSTPPQREAAQDWCRDRAVDTAAALTLISGQPSTVSLEERFADTLRTAREVAASCPVKMGGVENMDLIYGAAEHLQAASVIETGVAFDWSSPAILISWPSRPGARGQADQHGHALSPS